MFPAYPSQRGRPWLGAEYAEIFRALGDPVRLEMVRRLTQVDEAERWKLNGKTIKFNWSGGDGMSPFSE